MAEEGSYLEVKLTGTDVSRALPELWLPIVVSFQ
jgi:hypothetical protein